MGYRTIRTTGNMLEVNPLLVLYHHISGGLAECEAALARDPGDALAVSNKALCLVHLGQLTDALQLTEAGLNREPQAFLQVCWMA